MDAGATETEVPSVSSEVLNNATQEVFAICETHERCRYSRQNSEHAGG